MHRSFRILLGTLGLWWEMRQESIFGKISGGGQPMGSQFPIIFKIVTIKSFPISSILGSSYSFSWNFNFLCNLSDFDIEDLERLMSSLTCLHLSPFTPNVRAWFLSSSSLFIVKSFFVALSNHSDLVHFLLINYVWKSQVPLKVKYFVWLVTHKKVNTNDML